MKRIQRMKRIIVTLGFILLTSHAVRSVAVHGFHATYRIGQSLEKGDRAIGRAII